MTPTASWRATQLNPTPRPQRARRKQPRRRLQPLLGRYPRRQPRIRAGAVGRLHNESNEQSGRLVSSKLNHAVDPQTEQDLLESGKDDCHHAGRGTKLVSNWNPAISTKQIGYGKQGRRANRWEDDSNIYLQPDRETTTISRATRPGSPRRKTARNGMQWKATSLAADSNNQRDPGPPSPRLRQTHQQHTTKQVRLRFTSKTRTTPKTATNNSTTNATHLLSTYRQLNLDYTKATTYHLH